MPKEVYLDVLVLNVIGRLGPGAIISLYASLLCLIIVELLNGCVSDRDFFVAGTLIRHGFCRTNVTRLALLVLRGHQTVMMFTREISSD